MITLGIEGSANKLGVAILRDDIIVSNIRRTFHNAPGEGFRPSELGAHHTANVLPLIKEVLKESGIDLKDIDLIAYTRGPGIAAPLNVCAIVARILAVELNIQIVAVNHCIAHIEMGRFITRMSNPVVLYASGANTQIICYQSESTVLESVGRGKGRYIVLGEALDIAVGNCLDRVARLLNISNAPSPGFNIEQYAKRGKTFFHMPIPIKGMDISCSGIVEYINKTYINPQKQIKVDDQLKYDICFSLQENLFSALTEVTERAISLFKSSEVLIVGGVGCNLRLQEMISLMAKARNAIVGNMDDTFCVDNGAMIAYTGYVMFNTKKTGTKIENCDVTQRYRTETVEIDWD